MANGPSDTNVSQTPQGSGSRTPTPNHRVEIKNADGVQETIATGFNWIEDNARLVVAAVAILIVGGIAYAAWQAVSNHQEKVAQEAYYKVEAPFMKKKEAFEKSNFKAFMPPDANDKTPMENATGDIAKDYGALITGVESTAREYAGTAAGGQAAILAAQTYLEYKDVEKAITYSELAATKLPKSHTVALLGRVLWGNALSAKGDCQQALTVWQPILDEKKAAYLASDVNLRMGACLEKLGQNDRAAEAYRNAWKTESPAASTAKGLLRALELKNPSVADSGLKTQPAISGTKAQ